ncbi:sugar phosphate isomerase/epimerase [Chryseolinea sp. T2]|uniref:sugar phosphate isomerase/epimerase family protein n=1 Tax=Chryseolinea sp. T2 TaxID=3129255 RepID=UPI00307691D4
MSNLLSRREFISSSLALSVVSTGTLASDGNSDIAVASNVASANSATDHKEISSNKSGKDKPKGMRLGSDTDKLYSVKSKGPLAILDYLKENNFDGAFFRTMLDISPTLDSGQLKEVKAHADSLGLFLDGGIGWLNPYNTAETPEIRRFGKGDYRLAVEKMIEAAREIDCTELYSVSGHSIHGNQFFVAYDRFRTDVSWGDQLIAMKKFITMLSPMMKDLGLRANIETHGDETSFELIRMIEEIGPDVLGVTLDTGNLPLSGDVPNDAIKRLAPYVHCTHCKDGIIYRSETGVTQQLRTVGEGVVDWSMAIEVLGKYSPNLHLCFEDYRAENVIALYDDKWRRHFPELTDEDVRKFEQLGDDAQRKIDKKEIKGIAEYNKLPFGDAERLASYKQGYKYLKEIIRKKGLGYS